MAGRPRKPTQVLEDTGAFARNPQRRETRLNEPISDSPVGQPPSYFCEEEKRIWVEYVDEAPRGVLTKADRKHLAHTVQLEHKLIVVRNRLSAPLNTFLRVMVANGVPEGDANAFRDAVRTLVGLSPQEQSLLEKCRSKMGLNPSDRSKVTVAPEKKVSKFAGIAATLGAVSRPN